MLDSTAHGVGEDEGESVGEGGRGMQVYVETVVVNGDGVGARKT